MDTTNYENKYNFSIKNAQLNIIEISLIGSGRRADTKKTSNINILHVYYINLYQIN